ncbi:hypothetical protein XPA_010636 [Xanthoria parietina]
MRLSSAAASFLLLLPLASTEAFPALDPCWRRCITPKLPCKDGDWPCFCRTARQTSLFADTIACIRQTCTSDRPFDPIALLTPFTENCRKPISSDILSNADALAAQDSTLSDISASLSMTAGDIPALQLTTSVKANVITTTYIGIATNSDGQRETFTVPALVGVAGTIYGSPVTKIDGTASPTKVVTLPWPTLPVGYLISTSRSGVVTKPPASAATTLGPNVGVTTRTMAVPVGTAGAISAGSGDSGEGGTVLEASEGTRQGAKSSLGLMVVLLVGVMWF